MRKIKYGGYIENADIIKVCNKMNIYDITPDNIFRSNQLGGTHSVMVLYNNKLLYINNEKEDQRIFSVQTAYFNSYDLNSKPQDNNNFDNLSDQDKHKLFNDYKDRMQIYENKDHPNILFAIDAWTTACCIAHGNKYHLINIDLSYKEQYYKIDD